MLRLVVTGNGIGFNQDAVKEGNGLGNMRERAASMDGTFRIDTAPAKGTSIVLSLLIT